MDKPVSTPPPPLLPAIESKRLYRQIADVIARHIDDGVFPPGTLLPAERDLAAQMRVSRTSVREALIALEVAGRVSVRVGFGVSVLAQAEATAAAAVAATTDAAASDAPSASADAPDAALTPGAAAAPEVGPLQVVEARRIVEAETAAMAARQASDADLAELRVLLGKLEAEQQSKSRHYPHDFQFHLKIAQMSGNQALALAVAQLWSLRSSKLSERFEEHFVTAALFEDTNRDHRRIYAALEARDPDAARAAMQAHLTRVYEAYSIALA